MRVLTYALMVLLITLPLAGCRQPVQESQKLADTTKSSKGHQLFINHCASCHMGGNGAPNGVILQSPSLTSEEAFKEVLRHPPTAAMPAFDDKTLPPQDIHALYTYVITHRQ